MNNKLENVLFAGVFVLIVLSSVLFGAKLFGSLNVNVDPAQVSVVGTGSEALQSSVQKADRCEISTTTGKVWCAMLNDDPDQANRVITGVSLFTDVYSNVTSIATLTNGLDMSTSTSATATSSFASIWSQLSYSTSTMVQHFSTSTFAYAPARVWKYGEYLVLQANKAAATTGVVQVDYFKE